MPVVASDIASYWSTQFEVWFAGSFNTSQGVEADRFNRLIMDVDIPNFAGNRLNLNWLGAAPQLREWVDEKQARGLSRYEWEILVKRWEATIEVDLDVLADARGNVYEFRMREMAQNASRHRYNLLSSLLSGGDAALGYDGQYFFDTDHSEGSSGSQSNKLTGSGTSLANVTTDYYAAKAKLMQYLDDVGEPIWVGDFRPIVWFPAGNATLFQRFMELKGAALVSGAAGVAASNVLVNDFDLAPDPKLSSASNDWYMLNPEGSMKPFVAVNRETIHYEDNFGTGHPDVWSRRIGQASSVGRDNIAYAMWQKAVMINN
jgi:phage major head subunit gpT-like protein